MTIQIFAIAAMDQSRLIGKDGDLPWVLPEDVQRFRKLTMGHTVLMGRKTYQSLPKHSRPLPGRRNIVVTRNPDSLSKESDIEICRDPEKYLQALKRGKIKLKTEKLWVIGGAEIYTLTMPYWDELYLTLVKVEFQGDTYFPEFEDQFELIEEDQREELSFHRYSRKY